MAILEIKGLQKSFGGVRAVRDLSFAVREGETLGIIGPNGAGKTTVFNLVTGFYRPDGGTVIFRGRPITGIAPHRLAPLGITRTFQNLRLFGSLSVFENVMAAALTSIRYFVLAGIFRTGRYFSAEGRAAEKTKALLEFFNLGDRLEAPAGSLPYGDQRRLELARALALDPKLLLVDEPGAGMNPREISDLVRTMREMKERFDLTIVMIEHQMGLLMNVAERLVVMDFGEKIMEGTPEEAKSDRRVIEAYLGED